MELPGKGKRGMPKTRFMDVVNENMGEIGAKEKDIKTIRCGGTTYAVTNPD